MKQHRSASLPPPPPVSGISRPVQVGVRTGSAASAGAGGASALPPPPPVLVAAATHNSNNNSSSSSNSMTIDEMRVLHQRALQDAQAKRTELRLVLASRYRELVGSSDKVLRMKDRAQELHDLVQALPELLNKTTTNTNTTTTEEEAKSSNDLQVQENKDNDMLRRQLSDLARMVHRALDRNHVHQATTTLIQLFTLIAAKTDEYPMANALSLSPIKSQPHNNNNNLLDQDTLVVAQMRMIFLQVQTLPRKILRISQANLFKPASYGGANNPDYDPTMGAETSAAALSSLDLLMVVNNESNHDKSSSKIDVHRAAILLDKYYDSKARLLMSLLNQLSSYSSATSTGIKNKSTSTSTDFAESILSRIVLILQHDIVVHAYQIFILGKFPTTTATATTSCQDILQTLPFFEPHMVTKKCSKFLAAHLPLIRQKVKSVLVSIAGTTATALGQIRQSLYDKTDGCSPSPLWNEAVSVMIDLGQVSSSSSGSSSSNSHHHRHLPAQVMTADDGVLAKGGGGGACSFSLWSALFSSTFSSLVHSLLTTAFHSVHSSVVTTLRMSLGNAPPLDALLPHEAYRNTLRIATDLDKALLKVSFDSHELLVHAEERVESERRLRQSLYVQTCEILGRLVCEIRRIGTVENSDNNSNSAAVKELIVGRLCYLLKFRLTSLPKLLDPNSSPAVLQSTSGMISHVDLESAFSLADDNEDGLITLEEALEAVESAFSGTQFRGSEMVRETLLLPTDTGGTSTSTNTSTATNNNVTLHELTLLTARGLRHETTGHESALGTVQKALDGIVESCFQKWAQSALALPTKSLTDSVNDFCETASASSEGEWQRMYDTSTPTMTMTTVASLDSIRGVSPHVVGYLLHVSSILNCTTCPSDSLAPVPSDDYSTAMGIGSNVSTTSTTLTDTLRSNLLRHSLESLISIFDVATTNYDVGAKKCTLAILQLSLDVSFVKYCYFEYNQYAMQLDTGLKGLMDNLQRKVDNLVKVTCSRAMLIKFPDLAHKKHTHAMEACGLFASSLFGSSMAVSGGVVGGGSDAGDLDHLTAAGSPGGRSAPDGPFLHAPLASSRRFALLPIQSDRALSDLHLKGKYANKEKEESGRGKEGSGGTYMSSGLGFFSSMLKKK